MEAWHHVSTLVCTVATGDKITGDVKTLDKSENTVTVPEDSLCSQCSPACLYLCLCFLCVCVLAWASSPFSWLCSSCTPVWNRLITSPTLLTCLSSVHQLAVYLPLLFTHSWPDCCFNHSGSYDSRPIYFLFLVIQFLCVLHVNLFLLCPRIITCLPVLLLVCLSITIKSPIYPCLQHCTSFSPAHADTLLHYLDSTLLSLDPHSLPSASHEIFPYNKNSFLTTHIPLHVLSLDKTQSA